METIPSSTPSASSNVRTWCVLAHATALIGGGLPALGHLIGPLIIWLLKKDESAEVNAHGKESLNFQISMLLYAAVLAVFVFVFAFVLIGFLFIPLFGVLYLADIILVIIASIKASEGTLFRDPLTIRFLK